MLAVSLHLTTIPQGVALLQQVHRLQLGCSSHANNTSEPTIATENKQEQVKKQLLMELKPLLNHKFEVLSHANWMV